MLFSLLLVYIYHAHMFNASSIRLQCRKLRVKKYNEIKNASEDLSKLLTGNVRTIMKKNYPVY